METRKPLKRGQPLRQKSSLKRTSGLKSSGKGLSKASKTSVSKAKRKAWAAFSLYIRTRDPQCVTCGGANQHAGHFIDGRHGAVLFSEQGVHSQCYRCNVGLHGNKVQYWLFMEKTYGRPLIDQLILESKQTIKYKRHDYERIEQEYKDKCAQLLK